MKHYTTISQSKKLLSLGLSPESADMFYTSIGDIDSGNFILTEATAIIEVGKGYKNTLHCWSVGALLEVMPASVRISKNCDGNYNLGYRNFDTKEYLYMIDACFEITVWLLENGYIKKRVI